MRAFGYAVAVLVLALTPAAQGQPVDTFAYHGFRFDIAPIADAGTRAALLDAARAQVDIVEGVGLTPETLAYLRRFPIHLSEGPGGGRFGRDGITLNLPARADDRPILLHEAMHAYHFGRLPGGHGNADLLRFFDRARASGAWPQGSYMLSNPAEYFAMTASVQLYGRAARPPFTRAALQGKEPNYAAWLQATVR